MWASLMYKGRTYKTVLVTKIPEATPEYEMLHVALKAAGETTSSIFGYRVEDTGHADAKRVVIHTD